MKLYVKPELEYIELRAEEGLACTASTPVVPQKDKHCGNHYGWDRGHGNKHHGW